MKIYQELSRTSQANPHNQPGLDSVLTEPVDSGKDCKATEKNASVGSCSFTVYMSETLLVLGDYWALQLANNELERGNLKLADIADSVRS